MVKLVIFRRDLRTTDNTALNLAIEHEPKEKILPVFIFTPEQVTKQNSYRSINAIDFMINSLKEIKHLQCFFGDNIAVLKHIFSIINVTAVYFNKDHTHYPQKRDTDIIELCNKKDIEVHVTEDYNLNMIGTILTGAGTFYSTFTPYYTKANIQKVSKPLSYNKQYGRSCIRPITSSMSISIDEAKLKFTESASIKSSPTKMKVYGGRKEAMNKLEQINEFNNYHESRDTASIPTTHLSAHIKFGTISIREAYYAFKSIKDKNASEALVRQLFWNDFYDQLMHGLPYERTLGKSNFKKLKIKWESPVHLQAWKDGKTGFPFIDAGMRQLNQTGWMHNRARMAVANFLSMTLLIDWREGERYFSQKLVDCDVSQNNGNWQWSTGVGVDKTGYLRMYNPYSQSKSHDEECLYIKKFVPELKDVSISDIHNWEKSHIEHKGIYIPPIVDYSARRKIAIKAYKN